MSYPPYGPPSYYGYPPPPSAAPGAFAYVPAPIMMPQPPVHGGHPTYVTNYMYPPQPAPEPIIVVDNPPYGPPSYYGYPPPPSAAPGAFAYVPAPIMMPQPPVHGGHPTYVTNYMYPPQPAPEPIIVVDNPPYGPPSYYGYPPPPSAAPGAFAYVPAPIMMPQPPVHGGHPTYVTNYMYPPQPAPEPIIVVDNSQQEIIDWVPATPTTAHELYGRAYNAGKEGWDNSPLWAIRSHHDGSLIPGKLAIKHRAAYIPYAGREVPVHDFEVLCAPQHAVQWIPSGHGQVPPSAIIAGNTENAEPLYLGRARHKGAITPGKVHPSHSCCYISHGGSEIPYKQYEVLCNVEV